MKQSHTRVGQAVSQPGELSNSIQLKATNGHLGSKKCKKLRHPRSARSNRSGFGGLAVLGGQKENKIISLRRSVLPVHLSISFPRLASPTHLLDEGSPRTLLITPAEGLCLTGVISVPFPLGVGGSMHT